jgi:micrococcal nuclease
VLLLAAVPADAACPRGALTGEVTYIRDGDTIELGAMAIRFEGIAAPEWDTPTGEAATEALRVMVLGKEVRCDLTGKATYDRCVARCYLEGLDVEAELVRMGLARDCPRYSGGRHADAELQAGWAGSTIGEVYTLPGYCRPR